MLRYPINLIRDRKVLSFPFGCAALRATPITEEPYREHVHFIS